MRKTVPLKVKFGKNLKEYRIKAGHTQESLAEKTGMSATAISSIETGNSFPTYNNLISLLKELNIPACRVFTFAEDILEYSRDEKELLFAQIFDELTDDDKKNLLQYAKFLKHNHQ